MTLKQVFRASALVLLVLLVLSSTACGQKGPLTLPSASAR